LTIDYGPSLPPTKIITGALTDPILGSGCGWSERHEDVQKQLKPPDGGVFLRLNGIVIKSHGGFGTEGFADAINLG
jgi:hypothetical protein